MVVVIVVALGGVLMTIEMKNKIKNNNINSV